jgi:hypothetical protein
MDRERDPKQRYAEVNQSDVPPVVAARATELNIPLDEMRSKPCGIEPDIVDHYIGPKGGEPIEYNIQTGTLHSHDR